MPPRDDEKIEHDHAQQQRIDLVEVQVAPHGLHDEDGQAGPTDRLDQQQPSAGASAARTDGVDGRRERSNAENPQGDLRDGE